MQTSHNAGHISLNFMKSRPDLGRNAANAGFLLPRICIGPRSEPDAPLKGLPWPHSGLARGRKQELDTARFQRGLQWSEGLLPPRRRPVHLLETIRVRGGSAPLWPLHLARLRRSAALLGIPLPARLSPPAGADRIARLELGAGGAEWTGRPVGSARPVRLVTADWHMRRAALELAREMPPGVDLEPDAVPSRPSFGALFLEYHKLLARVALNLWDKYA